MHGIVTHLGSKRTLSREVLTEPVSSAVSLVSEAYRYERGVESAEGRPLAIWGPLDGRTGYILKNRIGLSG